MDSSPAQTSSLSDQNHIQLHDPLSRKQTATGDLERTMRSDLLLEGKLERLTISWFLWVADALLWS
jgi:hypothetical protein